jgi:hypothetical protein
LLCLLSPVLSIRPASCAQARVGSETIFRYFERETPAQGQSKVLPVYEYLNADVGELEGPGLSFHAYGWGRHAFGGEFFEDRNEGEFLYGFAQYSGAANNLAVRLGRQYVFEGASNTSIDGLRVTSDVTDYFRASAYGGLPVSLADVDGRSGDRVWGGRISHHLAAFYDVGVSYNRTTDDGDLQRETLAIDSSLTPPGRVSLVGSSVRDLMGDRWSEHSYEARISVGSVLLRPEYHRFLYDGFFDTGRDTGSPFRFLAGSGERVTVLGGDATWTATKTLDAGARLKSYDYKRREETARYYSGFATLHGAKLSQAGAEVGRMDGDTEQNRYTQVRTYFYWDKAPAFLSGDLVYVRYDEPILDESRSVFASLGIGEKLLKDAMEVKLSGDFSRDPYFDRDYRGMLAVKYSWDK